MIISETFAPLQRTVDNWKDAQKVEGEFGCLLFFDPHHGLPGGINSVEIQETLDFMCDWMAKKQGYPMLM